MVTYDNLEDIQQEFVSDQFDFPELIMVENITYSHPTHRELSLGNTEPGLVTAAVYHAREGDGYLGFVWQVDERHCFTPRGVVHLSEYPKLTESTVLGYNENIILQGINRNQPMECKIDTGADFCSLHATDIFISNQQVQFTIDNSTYRMQLVDTQTIQQADSGPESRPVIMLNVELGGQICKNVQFNLNDRSQMDSKILIGRNLLDNNNYIIKTNMSEMWSHIDAKLDPQLLSEAAQPSRNYEDLVNVLLSSDITFKQFAEMAGKQVMDTVSSLEY